MWNTSNSKVILRWDQVHALENESEVTGYKVETGRNLEEYEETSLFYVTLNIDFARKAYFCLL